MSELLENDKLSTGDLRVLLETVAEEECPKAPLDRKGLCNAIIEIAETRVGKYAEKMVELLSSASDLETATRIIKAAIDTADAEGEGTMATAAKKTAAKKAPAAKKAAPTSARKAPAAKKAAPTKSNGANGASSKRSNKYAGMLLKIAKDENPRRPGSHGFKSLEIIRQAGAKGIKTEDFLKAGGRSVDLAWDVDRKNVKVEKSA